MYDWVTVATFAGLIVLFLQRSVSPTPMLNDSLWKYLAASIGCGVVNWLGNHEYHVAAIAAFAALLGYIVLVLQPFRRA